MQRRHDCINRRRQYNCSWLGFDHIRETDRFPDRPGWQEYLPKDYDQDNVITYQWNQSREDHFMGHFNFYYSITRESVSKGSMFLYMILLLSIGVIGDVISNAVQALFSLFT